MHFIKNAPQQWIKDYGEVIILFKLRTSSWSKHFYLDFGCVYKKLNTKDHLKEIDINDAHLGHSAYNI